MDDEEVFILIEDVDLLMGKRLRQWRRVNVHRVSDLQRSVKLRRWLHPNGDEAVVQELLDGRTALVGEGLYEEGQERSGMSFTDMKA